MFSTGLEVGLFIVSFFPTLFSFFGQSYQIDSITRLYPSLQPLPGWVFGLVWGILFPFRDYGFYCVITDDVQKYELWIIFHMIQSLLLLLWPRIYADAYAFVTSFGVILAAWGIGIYLFIDAFMKSFHIPFWSQVALVAWLTIAAYLNYRFIAYGEEIYDVALCRQQKRIALDKECLREVRKDCDA